ncbi:MULTISPECIES: EscU/YscU/HrcU family type III secretion system export apparatus switch protein [Bacillaceae]|uniref:EscU/YscU/HrcU family type III secretion system export apparatus switch protein n=1 Tax=Evansella alkalicola TaxID=745819 RepID=A0ABS6JQC3_9BACI|nr:MULTISPECIES: EscU/YscU/HrcU family type III secretion system export apparatus switch protein [Bacillaceae]MBU9720301.1 EscU/YscU/HrcU family type III secretion system export apparatus switch protein [Bacillus alkalicola]
MTKGQSSIRHQKAVALGYEKEIDAAPVVKAKGKGYRAAEIVKRAEEANIPIQEDASLVELLSQLEMNQRIPPALYEVVAEIFSFIYKLDQSKKGKHS